MAGWKVDADWSIRSAVGRRINLRINRVGTRVHVNRISVSLQWTHHPRICRRKRPPTKIETNRDFYLSFRVRLPFTSINANHFARTHRIMQKRSQISNDKHSAQNMNILRSRTPASKRSKKIPNYDKNRACSLCVLHISTNWVTSQPKTITKPNSWKANTECCKTFRRTDCPVRNTSSKWNCVSAEKRPHEVVCMLACSWLCVAL